MVDANTKFPKVSNIDQPHGNPKRMMVPSPSHCGSLSVTESVALPPDLKAKCHDHSATTLPQMPVNSGAGTYHSRTLWL
jgi:hypothetical protein